MTALAPCARLEADLAAWRAGALPPAEAAALDAHAAACARCAATREADARVGAALAGLAAPARGDDRALAAALVARATATHAAPPAPVPWAWVAALALALALAALADLRQPPPPPPPADVPWRARAAACPLPPAELLPDGVLDDRGAARGAAVD